MDLPAWILDHQVRSEIRPRYEKRSQKIARAGFQLELFAGGPTLGADPGSAECRALYAKLVEVALLAIPPELKPVVYAPFDRAFHLAPGKEPLPEIELIVDIGPFPGPNHADAEPSVLRQVEERLRQLGVLRRGEPPVERRPARTAERKPEGEAQAGSAERVRRVA